MPSRISKKICSLFDSSLKDDLEDAKSNNDTLLGVIRNRDVTIRDLQHRLDHHDADAIRIADDLRKEVRTLRSANMKGVMSSMVAIEKHEREIASLKRAHAVQLAELNRVLGVHVQLNEILQTTVDRSTAIIHNGV